MHMRLVFEHLLSKSPDALKSLWFYGDTQTLELIASCLQIGDREVFRSRVLEGRSRPGYVRLLDLFSSARGVKADHVFLLELDPFIYALATARLPCRVSGVWFRPSYHYGSSGFLHEGLRQWALGRLKYVVLRALCCRPRIGRLLVFDQWAARYAAHRFGTDKVRYVPDPSAFRVGGPNVSEESPKDRRVFSILGAISRRKGVFSVLESLGRLTPEEQSAIELRIVGRTDSGDREKLASAVRTARVKTSVRIVHRDAFVSDEQMEVEIAQADAILLLYQSFVGSSGLLIRAALHGRPVVATRYGLLGALVAHRHLGITVSPRDQTAIAYAISRILTEGVANYGVQEALAFALEYSPSTYLEQVEEAVVGRTAALPSPSG